MLQQTQVDRVLPKYKTFIVRYPTAKRLAGAKLSSVLRLWSGLGYNRRAKYLWEAARQWGKTPLEDLPGVGPYTTRAVHVFAYNKPEILIETNIRSVYLHHLFPRSKKVSDKQLLPYMGVPRGVEPRVWYAALMDYGSFLKSKHPNPSQRSRHHTKQKRFKGSDREVRGAVLKAYLSGTRLSRLPFSKERIERARRSLQNEGLI
jgi:A/G-specific adenine glycosylase